MSLEFTCKGCGSHRLEEVMVDVCVVSEINVIDHGRCDYGDQTNDGGEIDRFQCQDCGRVLRDKDGQLIDGHDTLAEFVGDSRKTRPLEMGVALTDGRWYAGVFIDVSASTPPEQLEAVGTEIVLKQINDDDVLAIGKEQRWRLDLKPGLSLGEGVEIAHVWVYNSMEDEIPE
jgi:hypothetical protein